MTPVVPAAQRASEQNRAPFSDTRPRSDTVFESIPSFGRARSAGSLHALRPGVSAFRPTPEAFRPGPQRPEIGQSGDAIAPAQAPVSSFGYLPAFFGSFSVPLGVGPAAASRSGLGAAPAPREPEPVEPAHGFLRLLIVPRTAAVMVDGAPAGTADDFGGSRERSLPAGSHRVQLEAEGYQPVTIDVRVPANDTITLRRELDPNPEDSSEAGASRIPEGVAHKTIYFIPRCYVGDDPPSATQLPAGCHLADLRTIP